MESGGCVSATPARHSSTAQGTAFAAPHRLPLRRHPLDLRACTLPPLCAPQEWPSKSQRLMGKVEQAQAAHATLVRLQPVWRKAVDLETREIRGLRDK